MIMILDGISRGSPFQRRASDVACRRGRCGAVVRRTHALTVVYPGRGRRYGRYATRNGGQPVQRRRETEAIVGGQTGRPEIPLEYQGAVLIQDPQRCNGGHDFEKYPKKILLLSPSAMCSTNIGREYSRDRFCREILVSCCGRDKFCVFSRFSSDVENNHLCLRHVVWLFSTSEENREIG